MANELATGPEAAGDVPGRNSKAFRDRLLARLPTLGVPSWDTKDAFNVHEDMAGLGDLGADALLEPLAAIARTRG